MIISLRNQMFELANKLIGIYKTFDITKQFVFNPNSYDVRGRPIIDKTKEKGNKTKEKEDKEEKEEKKEKEDKEDKEKKDEEVKEVKEKKIKRKKMKK